MRRILFQGITVKKLTNHYSHPKVEAEVTPLIVIQDGKDAWGDDELHWGLILQCTPQALLEVVKDTTATLAPFEIDSTFSGWDNPVRWWLALQLLETMPILNHRNLGLHLWIATGRPDPDDSLDLSIIEELRGTLAGGYSYEEIMSRPVPMEVVDLTIRLIDEGLPMPMVRYDITDEIDAGTIRWSQELKRIGISHPDYRRAVCAALEIIVARYEAHLVSYAAFRDCPYAHERREKGFIMLCIEHCIYEAIEQEHGMDITAMLAILQEVITSDNITEELEKKHPPRDREEGEMFVRVPPEERFRQIITWRTEHFKKATLLQKDELYKTLHQLHEQWETMPIVNPLVR